MAEKQKEKVSGYEKRIDALLLGLLRGEIPLDQTKSLFNRVSRSRKSISTAAIISGVTLITFGSAGMEHVVRNIHDYQGSLNMAIATSALFISMGTAGIAAGISEIRNSKKDKRLVELITAIKRGDRGISSKN